jgi:hypothetical protein
VTNRKLDIVDWEPTPTSVALISHSPRWSPDSRAMGLVGALLLHILVVQPFFPEHAQRIKPLDARGQSAALLKSKTVPVEPLILVDLPRAPMNQKPLAEDLALLGNSAPITPVMLLSADSLPHVDISPEDLSDRKEGDAATDSSDPAARAALFGRYTGQLDARIERSWRRPRTPIDPNPEASINTASKNSVNAPAEFKCQVRILQDLRGNVQEVQMIACNGSAAWQHSLVMAILAASPLPAPPNPAVFTAVLTMTFSAVEFTTGSADDDYEMPPGPTTRIANSN